MIYLSNRQAAKKLGVAHNTLAQYIRLGKVPAPRSSTGASSAYLWSEGEIETVRQLLPKIANGRKTRYKKRHAAASNQQSEKAKPKKPKKK